MTKAMTLADQALMWRNEAMRLHQEIAWARGQFGSLLVAAETDSLNDVAEAARAGYARMEENLSAERREILWDIDNEAGDFTPQTLILNKG